MTTWKLSIAAQNTSISAAGTFPVTAVIPRDFSTDKIADFAFDDWIDFRRWFDEPNELSVENLLGQIPQSETVSTFGGTLGLSAAVYRHSGTCPGQTANRVDSVTEQC